MFDILKFDLGVNNFRYNLNKLLLMASLWNYCWNDTILTSSSDINYNLYRLCPWLVIVMKICKKGTLQDLVERPTNPECDTKLCVAYEISEVGVCTNF